MTELPPKANLTVSTIATYLDLDENTIYDMAAAGALPAFKVGRLWRIPRIEFLAWYRKKLVEQNIPPA